MISVGIDAIEVALPSTYLELTDLAQARGIPPEKYRLGLGQVQMSVPKPHEDSVTFGARAADLVLEHSGVDRDEIGYLIVASESAVDHAKSLASYIHGLVGLPSTCRVLEAKHACYAGTAALQATVDWIRSGRADGRKGLVVCTDVCHYGCGTPGEPTQGAGAVALLVSQNPRLVEMNTSRAGVHTRDTHDFWRPLHRSTPLVDGGQSQDCYVEALLATVKAFHAANGGSATLVKSIGSFAYHTPFPRMVAKAHDSLYDAGLFDCARTEFLDRVTASLELPSRVGNLYTGSLYLALLSVLLHGKTGPVSRQVGLFSYGSGFCAEFFVGTIMPQAAPSRRVLGALTTRHRISVADYEHLMAARSRTGLHSTREPYAYLGVQNDQRMYVTASHQCQAPVVQAAV